MAYPLVRTQSKNFSVGAGFDLVNQKTDFFGPLSRDRLRVIWARADFDAIDLRSRRPKWRVAGTIEARQGIDVFDASKSCPETGCPGGATGQGRIDADPTATVVRFNGTAEFGLGESLAVAVSPRAQYSPDKLLSFEQFTAGNYTVGRGYDPSVLTGDSGAGVAVELRGPRLTPFRRVADLQIQPYVFGDAAWTWTRGQFSDPKHLTSAGGGIRGVLGNRAALDVALAVPLERTGMVERRKGDARLLLTLTTRLLPWS